MLLALSVLAGKSFGQIWDAQYTGDGLANSPWLVTGNGSTQSPNFTTGPGTITIGDGSATTPWAEQLHSTSGSLWNVSSTAATVETTFYVNSFAGGVGTALRVDNGISLWDVFIADTYIQVNGVTPGVGVQTGLSIGTGSGNAHTLRVTYDSNGLDAYLDGTALSSLQDLAGGTSFGSQILLSRYSSAIPAQAYATYETVQWNNTQAISPIPEPGTTALFVLGGAGMVLFFKRVRSLRV